MKIGSALGLDFSEVDEEMLEEITRREEEDVARYEAMSTLKRNISKAFWVLVLLSVLGCCPVFFACRVLLPWLPFRPSADE
ncbi:hypothetical protein Q3G72_011065 [Acer saccharum]|nr:hypothetical protein Q3G72_011065 [Acer saccharum]